MPICWSWGRRSNGSGTRPGDTPFSPENSLQLCVPNWTKRSAPSCYAAAAHPSNPRSPKFFPALASFLPFSPAALNKLLTRKILGPLIEAMERTELPKMYASWESSLRNRIKEDGSIIVVEYREYRKCGSTSNNVTSATATTVTLADENVPSITPTTTISAASPLKRN